MIKKLLVSFSILLLAACTTPSQSVYNARDTGRPIPVEFGTVVSAKPITIQGESTGAGTVGGAVAGGVAGSHVGSGTGRIVGTAAGALAGAIAGAVAEEQIQKDKGMEYVIVTEKGKTITIAQYYKQDEAVIAAGQRVMIQTSGRYRRVLPADALPEQIERPKGIEVVE